MDHELPWIQADKMKPEVTGVGGSLILSDHKGVKICVLTLNKAHNLVCEIIKKLQFHCYVTTKVKL